MVCTCGQKPEEKWYPLYHDRGSWQSRRRFLFNFALVTMLFAQKPTPRFATLSINHRWDFLENWFTLCSAKSFLLFQFFKTNQYKGWIFETSWFREYSTTGKRIKLTKWKYDLFQSYGCHAVCIHACSTNWDCRTSSVLPY